MSQNSHFSDQELDTLFQEAAAQGKAPAFDDAYWAEMEAMLPAKKRRGVIFWFTVGGIPIVLGIIGLSLFGWNKNDQSSAQHLTGNDPSGKHNTSQTEIATSADVTASSEPSSEQTLVDSKTQKDQVFKNTPRKKQEPIQIEESKAIDPALELKSIPTPAGSETQVPNYANQDAPLTRLGRKEMIFTYPVTLNDVSGNAKVGRSFPVYVDFALGYGQSYRRIDFENNWMAQFKLGAGIYSEIGNMQLAAGLDLRAEVPGNLSRVTSDANYSNVTNFRGIYSVEFPLYVGGRWGRSSFGGLMIPGIQVGYSGNQLHYENTTLVSRNQVAGTIPDSKSLTMEFGARYGYALTEHVQFAASMNMDVLRPFQSDSYSGEVRSLPISFFLGLRRTF